MNKLILGNSISINSDNMIIGFNSRGAALYYYNGVVDTLYGLCKRFKANYSKVNYRIRMGYSLEDSFNYNDNSVVKKCDKIYTVDSVTGTVKDICSHFKINISTVCDKVKKGMSVEESILYVRDNVKPRPRKVYECGKVKGSIKDISEYYGVSESAIRYRLASGLSIEESVGYKTNSKITLNPYSGRLIRKDAKLFSVNGHKGTFRNLCDLFQIDDCTVRQRIKRGWSIEEAFTKKARKYSR